MPSMGGAALASVLHVAGRPQPSHWCCPIVIVQSSSSHCRPCNAAVVVIDIVAIGSGGRIITIAVAVAIAVAVSSIAVSAVFVNVASTTLPCHCCCRRAFWRPIGGAGPNHSSPNCPHCLIVFLDGWRSTCKRSACCCHPLPSNRCRPIVVVESPSSNHRPRIAAIVVIGIVAIGSGGGIILVAVAIAVAVSAIVIVNVASSTLLRHRRRNGRGGKFPWYLSYLLICT